jgi:hypothetical protein
VTAASRRAVRQPRDGRARERLREAQLQEANAVAATAAVDRARAVVTSAQGALVSISGIERAALLLGVKISDLRAAAVSRKDRTGER